LKNLQNPLLILKGNVEGLSLTDDFGLLSALGAGIGGEGYSRLSSKRGATSGSADGSFSALTLDSLLVIVSMTQFCMNLSIPETGAGSSG